MESFPEMRILGMGAAWGDYDGDGWLDLVVTGYDALRLFRNDGGKLVPSDAIVDREGFWAGASWADFDLDGDLDLYVCGYVQYVEKAPPAETTSVQYGRAIPYTLNPSSYEPERNLLFRNRGDGTFDEVGAALGVDNPEGRSLGALWHDFDDDGWLDLYVANDISDNVLYLNREDGTFEDASIATGVTMGRWAWSSRFTDLNNDGRQDIVVANGFITQPEDSGDL